VGGLDDVGLDHQIVVEEVGRPRVVGVDAADGGRGNEHQLRPGRRHPLLDLTLAAQVHLLAADGENLARLLGQPPAQRRADHTAMAGDPDPPSFEHAATL